MAGALAGSGVFSGLRASAPGLLTAGLLAGLVLATKYVMVVPAAAFMLVALFRTPHRERRRLLALLAPGMVLPVLPWLVRSWLFLRDPVYPLGAAWIPGLFGDPGLNGAEAALLANFVQETRDKARFLLETLQLAGRNGFVLAAALPFAVAAFSRRALPVLAASVLSLAGLTFGIRSGLGFVDRFAMPVYALWAVAGFAALMTGLAGAGRAVRGAALAGGILLAALFHLRVMAAQGTYAPEAPVGEWLSGRLAGEPFRLRAIEAYGAILPAVRREVGARPGRVLEVGESFVWGIPARVIPESFEPPFAWKAASESATPERISVRFRQAGVRWILYNHMLASWTRFQPTPFPWNDRMLACYERFALARLRLAASSGRCDPGVGCDWLYEVASPGTRPAASRILFLPGIESALSQPSLAWFHGALEPARAGFEAVRKVLPGVVWLDVLEAEVLLAGGRNGEAYRMARNAAQAGLEDDMSLLTWAMAASLTGKGAEAARVFARARAVCPLMRERLEEAERRLAAPKTPQSGYNKPR
jgi:hypothetical protein